MPRGGPGPTPHPPQTHGNGRLTPARYAVPLPAKLLSMWPSAPPSAAAASAPVLPCTRRAYRAARAAGCGQTGGHGRVAQRPPPRLPPGPHLQLGGLPLQPLRGQVGGLLAAPQEEIPAGQRDGDRERRGAGGGRTEGRTAPHSLTDGVGGEEHRAALQPQGGGPRGAQRGRRRLCGTGSSSGEGDRGGRAAQGRPRPPPPPTRPGGRPHLRARPSRALPERRRIERPPPPSAPPGCRAPPAAAWPRDDETGSAQLGRHASSRETSRREALTWRSSREMSSWQHSLPALPWSLTRGVTS